MRIHSWFHAHAGCHDLFFREETMAKDKVLMADGTVLVNVHTQDKCAGQPCAVHNPTHHHMAAWPHVWNDVLISMWRACEHGMIHPDPDDLQFLRSRYGDDAATAQSMHVCDGCCQPPATAGRSDD